MPQTQKLRADFPADIERAAQILRDGGTVAFPTETVYGLGANALSVGSVAKIFAAKGRPAWDPLIVHVASVDQIAQLSAVPDDIQQRVASLGRAFWPGPLTLLLPKTEQVPDAVTAGRSLVGLRVPAHPVAQALLRVAGVPVAAPSANLFGHTSPTTAQHVLDDLDGRIDAVLDGGPTSVGVESTVLDPTQTPIVLYRPGAVTPEQIEAVSGVRVSVFGDAHLAEESSPESLPSPGVGIRHYAPVAELNLVEGTEEALRQAVRSCSANDGVLLPSPWTAETGAVVERWGTWGEAEQLAAQLFAGLRHLDEQGVKRIFCPIPAEGGLNDAIRDRIHKAARRS